MKTTENAVRDRKGFARLTLVIVLIFAVMGASIWAVSKKTSDDMADAAILNLNENLNLMESTVEAIQDSEAQFQRLLATELAAAGDVAGMATFAALFQSGWFVESMWSQTLVVHMLRSPHLPSPRDHAAPALCVLTVLGLALVTWLPASPIADALGLMPLPTSFFGLLIGIVTAYIALTQLAKRRYIARHGELL